MAEDQQTAPAPAPISVPAPTPARGFRLGVKGALLIVLAAFALGVGLVSSMVSSSIEFWSSIGAG